MRYRGGGVGHLGLHHCSDFFLRDEHPPLGEISDALTELIESQDAASDSDNEGEDDDVSDRGGDDNDLDKLTQIGEWNDIDVVAAAGLGAL